MSADKYFDNYLDMFITPGWRQFLEDNREILDSLDLQNAKNWDEHLVIRTELEVRQRIDSFEEEIRDAIEFDDTEDEYADEII